jgi:hypothetical protein
VSRGKSRNETKPDFECDKEWLETEWSDDLMTLSKETWADRTAFIVPDKDTKSRRLGVRASVVA